jgi:protein gp37
MTIRVAHTSIEWVFNVDGSRPGYSVNPFTGCLNQVKGICEGGNFPCFAYKQSHGRCHKADLAGKPLYEVTHRFDGLQYLNQIESFYPRIHGNRFEALYNAPKGAGIFVCDRSDWAADYWPRWCQDWILDAARQRPDIRLYLLTKQPQELPKFSPFPDNVWVGVTCCNDQMLTTAWKYLKQVQAKIKFIFFEPLKSWGMSVRDTTWTLDEMGVNWVIIGGQTKPTVYPELSAVKEIVEAADKAGAKVFLKDSLKPIITSIDLRQEIPSGRE